MMSKVKLQCLGDIKTELPEIIPKVGDFVFVIESNGIPDPRKRLVLYKNRYGVLCQWEKEFLGGPIHRFFEHKFHSFRNWQKF